MPVSESAVQPPFAAPQGVDGQKKILLVGRYYVIEPLGVHYLAGLAKSCGWDVRVHLVRGYEFNPLYEEVSQWKPDLVGFSIWTGYHLEAFKACDRVRAMGTKVIIGGPHATYFDRDCAAHADYVAKGSAFRTLRQILMNEAGSGVIFDPKRMAEGFPMPSREYIYARYSVLAQSPIKSIIASDGCPYFCSYCYAPHFNDMYGGFKLILRPLDDIIREAHDILALDATFGGKTKMIYFQDDVFGFDFKKWLPEFARRWKSEVGLPFHCQMRLEMVQGQSGDKRLQLLAEAGCTGITLAIESGNSFLREFVLRRPMSDTLIVEGCQKIMSYGMTLRTEQILAVPFSCVTTDLVTLALNRRIGPTMAWVSILAPYGGTKMGEITSSFGFYEGNNDDLSEAFFDRSVLRHVKDFSDLSRVVYELQAKARQGGHARSAYWDTMKDNPLFLMEVEDNGDDLGVVYLKNEQGTYRTPVATIRYMTPKENERYCDQTVMLQRFFNWLARVPMGEVLARRIVDVPSMDLTWRMIGDFTREHLHDHGYAALSTNWIDSLALELGYQSVGEMPEMLRSNPYFFCFFPGSAQFARDVMSEGGNTFLQDTPAHFFDWLGDFTRHWLFMKDNGGLYRIEEATRPIASLPTHPDSPQSAVA